MPRPPITAKGEALFRQQLQAALDYLETSSGGPSLLGLRLTVSNTAPTGAATNDVWIRSASTGPAGIAITVSNSAPSGPTVGQIWVDTN